MKMNKPKILVIDDSQDITQALQILLVANNYQVFVANNGLDGIKMAGEIKPDLVILDIMMPEVDGITVCERMRENRTTRLIPIVMLTAKTRQDDIVTGLEAGADDYITKPFRIKELLARIASVLRRTKINISSNPLTSLPGNVLIEEEINQRIKECKLFAVCYVDLDKFKAYNDHYGYDKGDEVIKNTGQIILKVVEKFGSSDDFVGHIGGDDFIIVTRPEKVDKICNSIIRLFDSSITNFYDYQDKEKGYIEVADRQGKIIKIPIMTISIGVVTNEKRSFVNATELAEIAAEVKNYAKTFAKSNYKKDLRTNNNPDHNP